MYNRLFATILLLFALSLGPARAADAPQPFGGRWQAAPPSREAPALVFKDGNGQDIALRDFRGRVVLLNVWATWCAPCVAEMPSLDRLAAQMESPRFAVVALNTDRRGDVVAPRFYKTHALSHLKTYVDFAGTAMTRLDLRSLPSTILIGADGKEIGRLEASADWTLPENQAFLEQLAAPNQTKDARSRKP